MPEPTILARPRALDVARLENAEIQAWALSKGAVATLPVGALARALAQKRPLRIKLGLDPTAPDIHLGHAIVLERLRLFQDAGHEVVLIIGDYTARIGDPSGRSKTRPALSEAAIEAAAASYAQQVFTILDPERTEIRRNSEWLDMKMTDLFALVSSTTLAQLLEREDFAQRLRAHQPISMLEMLYPLIQGYDSVAVAADVEIGGTDQTFNLLLARDIQRHFATGEQVVLTMPLLIGVDGVNKMSKSLGNDIALTDSPADAFAKTMSLPDAAMDSWFKLLFDADVDERIPAIARKRLLARSVAERVGGVGSGSAAEIAFDRVHVQHQAPTTTPELTLPADTNVHLPALLERAFGCSRGQARRNLQEGGVKLDGVKLDGQKLDALSTDLRGRVLSLGKRRFVRLR
jgi:tyrosyl-tRNA synthetase